VRGRNSLVLSSAAGRVAAVRLLEAQSPLKTWSVGACGLESGDVALAAIPIRKMTIGIAQTLLLVIEWRIAMPNRTTGDRPELKPVNVGAAAIDIGSKMHLAAVNPACTDMPVRSFGTFTQDLHDLADWFKACGVTSVAMESG
jgi:hypothetical protein